MEALSYLFSPIPGTTFNYQSILVIYSAVLFGLGILIKLLLVLGKKNKALQRTFRSAPSEFLWIAIITFILLVSREKGIPYLSMRFLLFISLGLSVFYILRNIFKFFKKYPENKRIIQPKKEKEEEKTYSTKK